MAGACSHNSGTRVTFYARKGADCLGKFAGEAERTLRLLFDEVCIMCTERYDKLLVTYTLWRHLKHDGLSMVRAAGVCVNKTICRLEACTSCREESACAERTWHILKRLRAFSSTTSRGKTPGSAEREYANDPCARRLYAPFEVAQKAPLSMAQQHNSNRDSAKIFPGNLCAVMVAVVVLSN